MYRSWDFCKNLSIPLCAGTLVGDSLVMDRVYKSCLVTFWEYDTQTNIIVLDMVDFGMILGMDLLSTYHVVLDCFSKINTLAMPSVHLIMWEDFFSNNSTKIISYIRVSIKVLRGCESFLTYVWDFSIWEPITRIYFYCSWFFDVFHLTYLSFFLIMR